MLKIAALVIVHTLAIVSCEFRLTVLHTNDVHSRIEQLDKYGGSCSERDLKELKCFGGAARRYTAIENIRSKEKNVILLDGGDQYQGTFWFGVYQGDAAVKFMNHEKYDAMTLGNHEFDNGPEGIIPFINKAMFPIVSSNIDASETPNWPNSTQISSSTIIKRNGVRIGVIGYITEETKWLSSPGKVKFNDIITSIQSEAIKLKNEGVNILVALGHAGFVTDKTVAKEIKEIDIVVGGHSNTFLYTGSEPSNEKSEGTYPFVVEHADGSKTLVVQAFTFGKYLGKLNVVFNDQGDVTSWSGNPILLDKTIEQDQEILKIVKNMSGPIFKARTEKVGTTMVHLVGGKNECSIKECNMGNMVTDALVKINQITPDASEWSSVSAAMWNGGGLRASISKLREDPITFEDILTVLPFGNNANIAQIPGKKLKEAFEWSLTAVERGEGRFLQVSGIRVRYDLTKPINSRVTELKIKCLKCAIPKFEPVEDNKVYKIVTSSYLLAGGDGFSMFKSIIHHEGADCSEIVRRYIKKYSPIVTPLEGRTMQRVTENTCVSSANLSMLSIYKTLTILIILAQM